MKNSSFCHSNQKSTTGFVLYATSVENQLSDVHTEEVH